MIRAYEEQIAAVEKAGGTLVALFGITSVFWFFGPVFLYVIMPALDTVIGKDSANPPDSVLKRLRIILLLHANAAGAIVAWSTM